MWWLVFMPTEDVNRSVVIGEVVVLIFVLFKSALVPNNYRAFWIVRT